MTPKPTPQGLKRVETARGHKYTLDGKPVLGVTTLLSKGLPKPALTYWSAKMVAEFVADQPEKVDVLREMGRGPMVAALKGVPWQKRDEAAVRGTDVHALAEQIIHGREVDVPTHLVDHVDGYVRWLDAFQVEPVLTEFVVANRTVRYAGTGDAIVRIGGETLCLDWKTSTNVYGETALQTSAYACAEFYLDDNGHEQSVPEVDGIGVVHITAAGSRFHRFRDLPTAWDDFQHVAAVGNAIARIEAQLLDPTPYPSEEDAA